jgi:hypothetical protein
LEEKVEEVRMIYRAMRVVDGAPEVGDESLAQLGIRPNDVDQRQESESISPLDMLGMSVTSTKAEDVPFASPNKPVFRFEVSNLESYGLKFVPKPTDPSGGLIVPANAMTVGEFRKSIHSTAQAWSK